MCHFKRISVQPGQEAARVASLNALAAARQHLDNLGGKIALRVREEPAQVEAHRKAA